MNPFRHFVAASSAVFVSLSFLPAQTRDPSLDHGGLQPAAAPARLLPGIVPIHSLPDDPAFGPYGVWAGAAGYKVRFGDAVTFIPRLGKDAPRNLPIVWTTEQVRVGDHVLVDEDTPFTARAAGPARFEYWRGPVLEAYDVRPDGVEQTFVLATRPSAAGDLVVEGSLTSELLSTATDARHTELQFTDPTSGRVVASYGRAFVVDATGRKEPICTSFNGTKVRLCVPSAFLASAVYPVTVDPLTSPQLLNLDGYSEADVGVQSESTGQVNLVAYSLWTSSTDMDLLVFSYASNWTTGAQLFADLSDGWHSGHPAISYSSGADRWIVAFERQNTASQIRLYLHNRDNMTFNSGQMVFMNRMASNSHDWKADVGAQGGSSSTRALVVCQSEFGSQFNTTGASEVYGRVVDVSTGAMASSPLPLAGSTSSSFDRERPTVSTYSHGTFYWLTAWSQRLHVGASKFGVYVAQVDTDATVRAPFRVDDPAQDFNKVLARVDGGSADFLVTYVLADNPGDEFGRALHGTRFRNFGNRLDDLRHRMIVAPSGTRMVSNSGLAFDLGTASHWAVAWHTRSQQFAWVARVGYEAGITESHALTTQSQLGFRPVVASSASPHRFAVVNSQFNNIVARDFLYPSEAGTAIVGPGCSNATIFARQPYAGNANFFLHLSDAPPGQTAVPLLSFGQSALPLDSLGMVGCTLHLDPASLVTLPATSVTFLRVALVNLPLPDTFFGDLLAQWWYSDPAAPGGARVSPGMRIRVR